MTPLRRQLFGTTMIVRDPVTVGAFVLGYGSTAAATAALGAFVVGAVGYLATTLVTSWALSALAPKPDFSTFGTRGLLVNARDAVTPHDFVYGQARKGGTITYYESTGTNNKFLHQVLVLAGHEVEEIGDIYINDEVVTLDGDGFVTTPKWGKTTREIVGREDGEEGEGPGNFIFGDVFNSKIRIQKFDGSQTTAPADLLAESNQITGSFVGNGIAYLYIRFAYDQEVFANGLPLVTAVVKGKKVYDPRSDTTAYSANAALCVRDYLTAEYGLKSTDIDDTAFSVAANVCDEAVALSETVSSGDFVVGQQYEIKTVGTTDFTSIGASSNTVGEVFIATGAGSGTGSAYRSEPRYTMNGVLTANTKHSDILGRMMTACAGTLFWGGGKWQLVAADYTAPTKVLTLDDLRSGINLDTRTNLRDQFNAVQGVFNNAEARWITADYPPFKSAAFAAEDGGEETALDLELPLTTSAATAQRIAKLTLFRGREQMTLTADFGMNALDVEVGEIIALPLERYGWDADALIAAGVDDMPLGKEFEVVGWKFGPNQDAGDLRVTLTLRETSEAAFDWNAEESEIISNNSALLAFDDVPTLGIPAQDIVPSLRIVREKLTEVITINVTTGRPEAVDRVEVQFAEAGTSDWKSLGSGGLGTYEAVDLQPGDYKFRARAINSFGYFGSYTETGSVQTAGSAAPPEDVDGLFYEVSEGTTTLEWEPVTDLDLSFYRIRHAVEQTGATWANATTAVDKVPRPGTSVALPTRPGSYLIRAYDKTGIASQNYTAITVSDDEVPSFTQTLTQQDDTSFTGTKTGCEVSGSQLQITDPSSGPSEATYDFSDYIETHDSTARRVRARVDAAVFRSDESAGLWDNLPGQFDDLPGLFDDLTGAAQFADTNLLFYISTTNDDPAGTPTWSAYKQFRAGEFYGRAFRFRVVLKSTSDNVTPAITALSAIVEYN